MHHNNILDPTKKIGFGLWWDAGVYVIFGFKEVYRSKNAQLHISSRINLLEYEIET